MSVSPLLQALYQGDREAAAKIRETMSDLSVFEAAAMGEVDALEAVLAAEPDAVNAIAADGFFPLALAAFFGREDAVSCLLEHGADVAQVSANQNRLTALHSAAAARSVPIVAMLLNHGADPNAAQQGGFTALHSAALHGLVDMVQSLLAHGAGVEQCAEDGRSAVDLAREGGFEEVVALLGGVGGV